MSENGLQQKYADFSKAVSRLHEILQVQKNEYIVDATIQRFEFTYELAWKLLKAYLEHIGITGVNSPREAFKEAYAAGLITDGDNWIKMLQDRNLTTHTYNEQLANTIYNKIKEQYIQLLLALKERLKKEIKLCALD